MSKTNVSKQKPINSKNVSTSKKVISGGLSSNPVFVLIFATFAGIVALAVATAAFSLLLGKSSDPDKFISTAAVISTVVAGSVCGFTSAKLSKKALPWSVLSALFLIVSYLVISLFFDSSDANNDMLFKTIILICLLASSCAAGILAVPKKKSNSLKRKRR